MNRRQRLMYGNNSYSSNPFAEAPFIAELRKSLVLNRGTGSPTYTRATTATFTDFEGVLRTAIAGEARFVGARRVRNLVEGSSENLSAAGWVTSVAGTGVSVTVTPGNTDVPSGTSAITSSRVQLNKGAGTGGGDFARVYNLCNYSGSMPSTGFVRKLYMKSNTGLDQNVILNYPFAGAGGKVTVTSSWTAFPGPIGSYFQLSLNGGVSGVAGTADILVTMVQVEDRTGASDTTTPSEYVSVGVLSSPYHGAGVDGVKYFDTTLAGVPISSSTLKGYLSEGSRQNVALQSQAIGVTTWTAFSAATTTGNNIVAPDGTTTATKVVEDATAASARQSSQSTITIGAGESLTMSVYVKRVVGTRHAYLACSDGTNFFRAVFNLDTVAVGNSSTGGTGTYTSGAIESLSNGGFRCTIVGKVGAASTSVNLFVGNMSQATDSTSTTYNGDGSSALAWWGGMLERNATFASTYIPTTTVAVTKNSEVDSIPTSGNITAAQGWIYMEYTPTHAPSGTVFLWGTYVDANNYTAVLHDGTNLIFRKRIASVNYDATIANAFTSGTTYKMAATWSSTTTMISLNGTAGTPSGNGAAAQIGTTMQFGADGNSANQPFMWMKNERIGQSALSAAQVQVITT